MDMFFTLPSPHRRNKLDPLLRKWASKGISCYLFPQAPTAARAPVKPRPNNFYQLRRPITLCASGPRRKEQWPHMRLSQTCLWVSGSLRQRRGSTSGCCGVRGTESNSPGSCSCWQKPFWRRCYFCHYPYHSLAWGQTIGREHSLTHQLKIGLKIYWAWPRPSDSPTASSSHQEASISLLSLSIRRKTEWKPQL